MKKFINRIRSRTDVGDTEDLNPCQDDKIKDYRSLITPELLAKSERFTQASAHVCKIDRNVVVKTGDAVRMTEAHTLRYVREKTSVPVPTVYDSYIRADTGHICIVMEYVDGETLEKCWPTLTEDEKDGIIIQLKSYMSQLRSISHTKIGSIDSTHCEDQFFDDDPTGYGPYESEHDFQEGLIKALRGRAQNSWTEMVVRFIQNLPKHQIVLTHNDIAPRNILVRDAKVVAIIDWELAGFYPEYWEYVKALFWPDWQSPWITEGVVDKILQPYITELAYLLHAREIIY